MSEDALKEVFVTALGITPDVDVTALSYRGIEQWDSVAHMQLVGEIEDRFDIMIDTQDVIDMSSYAEVVRILGKYGVTFDN